MFVHSIVFATCLVLAAAAASNSQGTLIKSTVPNKNKSARAITIEINGANYTLGLTHMNFYEAEIECWNLNKRLLVLETRAEAQFWMDWLSRNPQYDTWSWIGGRRDAGTDEFIWVDTGEPFDESETLWGVAEPNSSNTYPQCVSFAGYAPSGGWEDDNCSFFQLSYICEDDPTPPQPKKGHGPRENCSCNES